MRSFGMHFRTPEMRDVDPRLVKCPECSHLSAGSIRFRLFCCYVLALFVSIFSIPVLGRLNFTLATSALRISTVIVVLGIVALPFYITYRLLRYAVGLQYVIRATSLLKGKFIHSWPYLAAHLSVIFLITLLTAYRFEYRLAHNLHRAFRIAFETTSPVPNSSCLSHSGTRW